MTNIKSMQKHRENMKKYSGGGVRIFVAALLVITLFWLLFSCYAIIPASAQAPIVTPLPGPAATATAAAQSMSSAQVQQASAAQMQAQAEAQRQQANALQQQANAARASADASYSAASQAASDARAALAAQQAGAAGEAIGRAEASISEGKAQLSTISSAFDRLREMYDLQAGQIISLTIELRQAQVSVNTVTTAYNAALANQERTDRNETIIRIVGATFFIVFMFVLFMFARDRLRQRMMHSDDGGATDETQIIDNEE